LLAHVLGTFTDGRNPVLAAAVETEMGLTRRAASSCAADTINSRASPRRLVSLFMAALGDLLGRCDPDPGRRGRQFERICQWFLTHDPVYARELRHVWLWDEWPGMARGG
jgi:hypothetical protein